MGSAVGGFYLRDPILQRLIVRSCFSELVVHLERELSVSLLQIELRHGFVDEWLRRSTGEHAVFFTPLGSLMHVRSRRRGPCFESCLVLASRHARLGTRRVRFCAAASAGFFGARGVLFCAGGGARFFGPRGMPFWSTGGNRLRWTHRFWCRCRLWLWFRYRRSFERRWNRLALQALGANPRGWARAAAKTFGSLWRLRREKAAQ